MSELTKTVYNGKLYFIDERLQELRAADNPHDVLSYAKICQCDCSRCILTKSCEADFL